MQRKEILILRWTRLSFHVDGKTEVFSLTFFDLNRKYELPPSLSVYLEANFDEVRFEMKLHCVEPCDAIIVHGSPTIHFQLIMVSRYFHFLLFI